MKRGKKLLGRLPSKRNTNPTDITLAGLSSDEDEQTEDYERDRYARDWVQAHADDCPDE